MNLTVGQAIAAFIAAMGVPGAVMGLIVRWLTQRMDERDKARELAQAEAREAEKKRAEALDELELLNIQATLAAIELAEATARAVERIPDSKCNGDMHSALEHAKAVKQEVRDFMAKQATRAVVK